ncbi:MAG: hypothetical protein A3I11_02210 [Elusimicrobia bacterium RIFCSPLOWO2_02_FULL_39_32]|nr:MAG: hypothetical protein A2034_01045 [Elusimicrobia bacterium GWA2_38_7]OGR78433.1 MAG: hypothetical protein A3B80_07095 [Elusimicrobia bacterium RIFCSPHIGHO2_02_FULL_39_36]OGR92192.1 MAG: hypothetical protein A3I11_02210 [Elusimicrobia bacterium RIFCSPLOWO2_02_FULL_39_32]OGR99941.1 MAG: hypothetical protein A3G85_03230 [Elusimicrobia bacterium RIFCSPLOWO2_12_FULL_39_28]
MIDPQIEDLFIQTAGELAESVSINRVVGQLYALLYIRPEPVSLDKMAEKLKISKGSASVNIRVLETWNAVKKVWIQGSRKDFYTAEPDILKLILERLDYGFTRRIALSKAKVDLIHSILNSKNEKASFYKERLKQLEELQNLVETFLKFLPKVRSLKNLKKIASFL